MIDESPSVNREYFFPEIYFEKDEKGIIFDDQYILFSDVEHIYFSLDISRKPPGEKRIINIVIKNHIYSFYMIYGFDSQKYIDDFFEFCIKLCSRYDFNKDIELKFFKTKS